MTDNLWDLPEGWRWASFSDVADINLELVDAKQYPEAVHIAPNHIESGTGRLLMTGTVSGDKVAGPKHRFRAGQILYSKIRPYLAKAVIAPCDGYCSSDMYPVTARYSSKYLLNWLVSPAFTHRVSRDQGRTVLPKVNLATLNRLPVPVAPESEQKRIVAKLESLQTRSRRAREALDAVPPLLEKLRQSILAAAFRGDLTKDWRAAHPDVEPASELLERIRAERRKKWEEAELAKLKATGKLLSDDKWKAKYKEPQPLRSTGLPELPNGWCWASMDQVLSGLRNGISATPDREKGLPILRISAVRPLRVDVADVRFLAPVDEYSDYVLADGDLLLTRYNGNPNLVGVAGVVKGLQQRTVYPDKLIRATPVESVVSSDFLALAFNTGITRAHIAAKGKSAAGQVGVSGADIRDAPVPVPPLREQVAIVQAVSAALLRIGVAGTTLAQSSLALAKLESAMLAKAFRGELIPQNPSDEPADVTPSPATTDALREPARQRTSHTKAAE